MKKLILLTIAGLLGMAANALASGGEFFIPGSALPIIRQQIAQLPGGVAAATVQGVRNLRFVYNSEQDTLESWNGTHQQGPITISGSVALAVMRGISERKRAIPARFLALEKEGRMSISGYDHGNSIYFMEHFEGITAKPWTPGTLDPCAPGVQYVIGIPSLAITNLVVNDC